MSFTELYENADNEFIGVVVNDQIKPVRIVYVDVKELTPELFQQARNGFKGCKKYETNIPLNFEWCEIENTCNLVATFTSGGGFLTHDYTMSKAARSIFGKGARIKYAKKYHQKANCNLPYVQSRRV